MTSSETPRLDARAIFGEVLDRLLDGDMKDRKGSHGRNYIEQLAYQMFLDPAAAEELAAAARLPQIKAAVDRATAINAPKQAIMDRLASCKTLFADETFFRRFPARLCPLFPWQPSREPIHPLEGVYLPLNRWGAPLGEGRDWDGEFDDYAARAWTFRWDDDTPDEHLYDIGYSPRGLSLMDHYTDSDAPAFLATYAGRLRRVLAEALPLGALLAGRV